MCFIRMSSNEVKAEGDLKNVEFWLKQATELQKLGSLFLLLTGGEPFLYPEFNQLYTELKKMGFIITINTNGTCITDNQIRLLSENPPRCINVTLYGASNETYNRNCHTICGYTKCIENIRKLKSNNIHIKLNYSATKLNVDDFEKIVNISNELDIPLETNSYMFPFSRSGRNVCYDTPRLDAETGGKINALAKIFEKKEKYNAYRENLLQKIENDSPNTNSISLDCHAGSTSLWINWKGVMTPCVMMETPCYNLENISIKEAWDMLKQDCKALVVHKECIGCNLKPLCQVCYASACLEKKLSGDLSYLCAFAKAEYEILRQQSII